MKNKAFETIIDLINNQLSVLGQNGYKIFDAENPEFFIQRVRYDSEDDTIKFDTEEQ
ncbi:MULTISPECIES: hypothetical protein [Clostridium]|uniref:Uncharacterized protein n=1 Tax=Clostridium neuense TaxID=1728934 RepID=A0ABW8TGU4_9CLOT|nr:hypothetical protein [Clostridium guangxiense]MCD2345777.1 hypothetical protein [Clostridium guangxiense]